MWAMNVPQGVCQNSRFVSEWRSFPIRKWSRYEILVVTARFLETVTRALIAWTRFPSSCPPPSLLYFSFFQRKLILVLVLVSLFLSKKVLLPRRNIWRHTRGLYDQRFNFQTLPPCFIDVSCSEKFVNASLKSYNESNM